MGEHRMTERRTPAEIAVLFLEAFARKDVDTLTSLLADDIVFESPQVRLTGAPAVADAIGGFAQVVTGVEIMGVVGDEERAMIMYDMHTGPFGTLKAVDHLEVRDGRIISDTLVFDTYPVRTAADTQATTT
jgi:hypothetical protein